MLPPLLATEADRRKQREVEAWFRQLADQVSSIDPVDHELPSTARAAVSRLLAAVEVA